VVLVFAVLFTRIEILWKKIKYDWLLWEAYASFQSLRSALLEVLHNYGEKYQVNFMGAYLSYPNSANFCLIKLIIEPFKVFLLSACW
jgi:hypothetical protein